MKEVKFNLITVLCIIITFIIILLGTIYYYNNKLNECNKKCEDQKPVEVLKIKKIDETKEVVYDSFTYSSSAFKVSLPYININSNDANKINKEIDNLKKVVQKSIDEYEQGSPSIKDVKYYTYINNNILSVVIINQLYGDVINYNVYNIDIYQGTIINNSNLLNTSKINQIEFLNGLKEIYKSKFISLYGTKEEYENSLKTNEFNYTSDEINELKEKYDDGFKNTTSYDNITLDIPMYLDSNNKVNIIATIYSLEGTLYYYNIEVK
ncbi:MAG: hypothetical protein IJZ36_00805 [Bacilli bacterium]|nr:hypothetical protein [Bacilli bacterium]